MSKINYSELFNAQKVKEEEEDKEKLRTIADNL